MDQPNDNLDDLLDRALAAMRNEPELGDFPAGQVLHNIAASSDAARQQHTFDLRKKKSMKTIFKLAAAVLLALALAAIFFAREDRRSLAFAEVAHQIQEAQTMTAELVTSVPGLPPARIKAMFRGPGQFRLETPLATTIANTNTQTTLTLNNLGKTALILHVKNSGAETSPAAANNDWFATLKRIASATGKPVGDQVIDGTKAHGFEVTDNGQRYIVWADARTGSPLRVEILAPGNGSQAPLVTLDQIKLDVPLPESLFRMDVPPGYKEQTASLNVPNSPPTEEDLIDLLRAYSAKTGGRFPKGLGMQYATDIAKTLLPPQTKPQQNNLSPEVLNTSMQLGRAIGFLAKITGKWGYAGATTSMGDASKPLFWYQPEGSTQDRVIYGDLHVGQADPKDLPEATHTEFETTQPAAPGTAKP